MTNRELETLGEPDLKIAGLRLWLHGREFPHAMDYWDGNCLRATACYECPGSIVCTHRFILHLGDIYGLLWGLENLYTSIQGRAVLECMEEPALKVELLAQTGGKIRVNISVTPDSMSEDHRYTNTIDQTCLPPMIAACQAIFAKFPLREPEALER